MVASARPWRVKDNERKVHTIRKNAVWVALFLLLVTAFVLGLQFRIFLEDLQTALFPAVVLLIWGISGQFAMKLPRWIVALSLALWLAGAVHVRALVPPSLLSYGGYLSRLDGDPDASAGRELYRRFNQISEIHGLTALHLIQRRFEGDGSMQWLRERENASLLISGTPEWLQVTMRMPGTAESTALKEAGASPALAAQWGVRLDIDGYAVPGGHAAEELVLATAPSVMELPGEPKELSRHFLAYFSQALAPIEELVRKASATFGIAVPPRATPQSAALAAAARQHYLLTAAAFEGAWRSAAPRGTALFVAGSLELLGSIDGEPGSLGCARALFADAAGFVQKKYAPDLYAAIFNNAALAMVLEGPDRLADAVEHFRRAAAVRRRDGTVPPASRIALLNLELLQG